MSILFAVICIFGYLIEMMIKSKILITLTLIIFSGLTFIETANSATAQSAARAVLKAKKCYNATPSTYKKGMLTSMSRAVTHWSDGNKFSKSNNAQMANWNFNTATTYANMVLQIGRAYRITACN
tara:strand:+ start:45 stop:419 length:375 start_codon:yes stop_codon:yes gene_type:complete